MKRDTIGKIASDLLKKESGPVHAIDQMRESLTDYDRNLFECIETNKKRLASDFFVVVLTKKERLMPNVIRNYFYARLSCPTPDYDQIVYKYNYTQEKLDFLWAIPSRDTCHYLKDNSLILDKSEYDLLKFVLDFADGTLFKRAKILNGEQEDSPLLA